MQIKAIVAVDRNWGIGSRGGMLFNIPEDLEHFKNVTQHNVIVVGRPTLKAFKNASPLLNRTNIVFSRFEEPKINGALIVKNFDELSLALSEIDNQKDVFVVGGGEIYRLLLPYCEIAIVTKFDTEAKTVDTFFPNLDIDPNWQFVECVLQKTLSGPPFKICYYKNLKTKSL